MRSDANCLKTGCDLEFDGAVYHGDLFEFGPYAYLFNAVIDERGEAREIQVRPAIWPTLHVHPQAQVFERRGLFIIHASSTTMNQALSDYIRGASRG